MSQISPEWISIRGASAMSAPFSVVRIDYEADATRKYHAPVAKSTIWGTCVHSEHKLDDPFRGGGCPADLEEPGDFRSGASRPQIALNLSGVAGIAFFAIYFARRVNEGEAASALWACHLASLLAGAGILLRRPAAVGIGVLWLLVGIPMWFVYLSIGGPFRPTSFLTHFGGFAVGCLGLRALGMPRQAWWKAMAGLLILLGISRWVSPPTLNVNLSFHVYQLVDPFPGYYAASIIGLTLGTTLFFFVAEQGLRRVFPTPTNASRFPNRESPARACAAGHRDSGHRR
jgi:hypothetical protein